MDSMQGSGGPQAAAGRAKGISGSTVKIIAVLSMLIDHTAAVILERQILTDYWGAMESGLYAVYMVMRLIGRLGFPIFCFLLVEGFQRTRSVAKYALRLGIFVLASEVPFDLAFKGRFPAMSYQNVFFTLLLGLLALWVFDCFAKHELPKAVRTVLAALGIPAPGIYLVAVTYGTLKNEITTMVFEWVFATVVTAVVMLVYRKVKGGSRAQLACIDMAAAVFFMCAAEVLKTDYAGMGVLTIAVMYLFRKNRVQSMLAGCIVLTVMSLSEITAFFALIPIALYNGSRGLKMKYFFYAFYPVHLLILYLICVLLGLSGVRP